MKYIFSLALSVTLLAVNPVMAQTQTFSIVKSIDVQAALRLIESPLGIDGNASGGLVKAVMYSIGTNVNGGPAERKIMFGCQLDINSGYKFVEKGWTIDEYFPWYCYIGFCQGDNANSVVIVKSNSRAYSRAAILGAAEFFYVAGTAPIDDVDGVESIFSRKLDVRIELTIENVSPCKIYGIKLPGIDLCIKDFIPDVSNVCPSICDFNNGTVAYDPDLKQVEHSYNNSLTVYPNPSKGSFQLSFNIETAGTVACQILDLHGRMVHKQEQFFTSGQQRWMVDSKSKLAPGMYFLKMTGGGQPGRKLIIVN